MQEPVAGTCFTGRCPPARSALLSSIHGSPVVTGIPLAVVGVAVEFGADETVAAVRGDVDPLSAPTPLDGGLGAGSAELEELSRRLLLLLGTVTGLESTYLTRIDWEGGTQAVVYSSNTGELNIPEGLSGPYSDTLCRRALDGTGPRHSTDVASDFGEAGAGFAALGLRSFVTVPVELEGAGRGIYGTVCGASSAGVEVSTEAYQVMEALAEMISLQLRSDLDRRALADANVLLRSMAYTDPLTKVGNRRAVEETLARTKAHSDRHGEDMAVISVDVDNFKSINDTFGHGAGDEVLIELVSRVVGQVRADDVVGRLGGDEFLVVLPATDLDSALVVAARIRDAIVTTTFDTSAGPVGATASIGVASVDDIAASHGPVSELLRRADTALYTAKHSGRNTIST